MSSAEPNATDLARAPSRRVETDDPLSASGIERDYANPGDTFLVAFGGIKGELEIPVFEFTRLARELPAKKLFLRDLEQCWYHRGIAGIATDLDGLVAYIRTEARALGCRRIATLGNSMGGYAAILVGSLLSAEEIVAFSPQTFVGRFQRWRHGDRRWAEQIARARASDGAKRHYYDLARVLRRRAQKFRVRIYYGNESALDTVHAQRLGAHGGVTLHAVPAAAHNVVRRMRDSGDLVRILREILALPAGSVAAEVAEDLVDTTGPVLGGQR